MANLFSSVNYPTTEPETIIAGDRLAWKRTDLNSDYSNSLYTLSYKARLENSGSTVITITASASGSDYLVEVASATTAAYTTGIYHWQAYITRDSDSERIQIDSGTWHVKPNLATSTADPRSDNKIILDALIAVQKNKATLDQKSYTIAGRSLTRMDADELIRWTEHYQVKVNKETMLERAKNGKPTGQTIKVRFS